MTAQAVTTVSFVVLIVAATIAIVLKQAGLTAQVAQIVRGVLPW